MPDPSLGPAIFIAVPLSDDARAAVVELVDRVRAVAPGTRQGAREGERAVRWVRMDGLHMTLRFIGPTEPERIDAARDATVRAAAGVVPFSVHLTTAGSFPDPRRPRTLWLGATVGADALLALNDRVDTEVERGGWQRDTRPFRPHLTLARSDGVAGAAETARILVAEAAPLDVRWAVDRLVLFESVTGGGPARYEPLLVAPFAPGDGRTPDADALPGPAPRG